jgi:hypothetical protein
MTTRMERAEAYAESTLEGRSLPSHDLMRVSQEQAAAYRPPGIDRDEVQHWMAAAARDVENAITADMERLKAWITMAYAIGYAAGQEDNDHGVRVRKRGAR